MALIIKGKHIENFKDCNISVISGANADEIMPAAARSKRAGTKLLEWRIDYFDEYQDAAAVRETLDMLSRFCDEIILIATLRTKKCGGDISLPPYTIFELYDEIAQSHSADLLDVEPDTLDGDASSAIASLHDRGQIVLASSLYTPFDKMESLDADVGRNLENDTWKIFI